MGKQNALRYNQTYLSQLHTVGTQRLFPDTKIGLNTVPRFRHVLGNPHSFKCEGRSKNKVSKIQAKVRIEEINLEIRLQSQ